MNKRISILSVSLLFATALVERTAVGQGIPYSPPSGNVFGGSAMVMSTGGMSASIISDMFLGKGTVGPFLLSYKLVSDLGEVVVKNGRRLSRNEDYRFDPRNGILTFTSSLRNGEVARIDYSINPSTSQRSTGMDWSPIAFDLVKAPRGLMTLTAFLNPSKVEGKESNTQIPAPSMYLGLASAHQFSKTHALSAKLFLDASGGNIRDRAGLLITDALVGPRGQLNFSYNRGGALYKGGDSSIAAGKETLHIAAALQPYRGIAAATSFMRTTDLPATGRGISVTALKQSVSGSLGLATRFAASHSFTETIAADGARTITDNSRFQLDRRIDKHTSAVALIDRTAASAAGDSSVTQTTTLNIRSQPANKIALAGQLTNRLFTTGPETTGNLRMEAVANKSVKLSAIIDELYSTGAPKHSREAGVEYQPSNALSLTGALAIRSQGADETRSTGIKASARPTKFLEIGGGAKFRSSQVNGLPDPNMQDTYDVHLSLGLNRDRFKLTGAYGLNPEDDRGNFTRVQNRQLGVSSKWGTIEVTGNYSVSEDPIANRVSNLVDMSVGWSLHKTARISSTFRRSLVIDKPICEVDTFGLKLTYAAKGWFDLALSGTRVDTLRDGIFASLPDYRAEAKLGVRF